MISFDTNLLVYAADRDAGDRHRQAAALIEVAIRLGRCIQPLQSLAEFYNAVTRRRRVAPERASAFVAGWQAVVPVEAARIADLDAAIRAVATHGLAFWDALLWAILRRAGVGLLASEDFQDGRVIEGVRIANPFNPANAALIEAALRG